MLSKQKIIILVLLFSSFSIIAEAQEKKYRYMIMGSPQELFISGLRIDVDVPLLKSWRWVTVAPVIYFDDNQNELEEFFLNHSFEKLRGAGITVSSKTFISKKRHGQGLYAAFGGGYQLVQITTNDFKWVAYTEDNFTYIRREPAEYSLAIHTVRGQGILGLQTELTEGMFVDVYMGLGLKFSMHELPQGSYKKFNEQTIDYGYTGTLFVGGIRFGIALD